MDVEFVGRWDVDRLRSEGTSGRDFVVIQNGLDVGFHSGICEESTQKFTGVRTRTHVIQAGDIDPETQFFLCQCQVDGESCGIELVAEVHVGINGNVLSENDRIGGLFGEYKIKTRFRTTIVVGEGKGVLRGILVSGEGLRHGEESHGRFLIVDGVCDRESQENKDQNRLHR